ncbi:MAG: protein kinase [Kofleriaceae bacterium]|nr:protein kinase [Kofleriaceae bacterium]
MLPRTASASPTGDSGLEATLAGPSPTTEPAPGLDVVASDPYLDRQLLGRGGMGQVFAARDRRLRRTVAVKELRRGAGDLEARFVREALLTARLQHPSIISVYEAGRWPDGAPYYAMRLVAGRSLEQALAGATERPARLALLPNLLAVADALAYAHSQRIIHRDLKPANVMLGDFGETVVIDWGLAKDLAEPSGPARHGDGGPDQRGEPARSATDGGDSETRHGEILGTPAYMAPEQAAGAAVDERTDVFALGAILYHVLSGQLPYTGASAVEVMERIQAGRPRPLREVAPGLPPDLVAIVDRAMAPAPAARYPSARELAEDLRRFTSGQMVSAHHYGAGALVRRWLRRHRALVAVSLAALVTLAALATVGTRRILAEERAAQAARRAAEQHRRSADELVMFIQDQVTSPLQVQGQSELLNVISLRVLRHFQTAPMLSFGALRGGAQALALAGETTTRRGAFAAAEAYLQTGTVLAVVARSMGDDAHARSVLMQVVQVHGDLATAVSDPARAAGLYQRALDLESVPTGAADFARAALLHGRIGDAARTLGELDRARQQYQEARLLIAEAARLEPGEPRYQRELAVCLDRFGELLAGTDPAAALAPMREAMAIRRARLRTSPADPIARTDLSMSYYRLGTTLAGLGQVDEALDLLRADLGLAEQVARDQPSDGDIQRNVAVSHAGIAEVLARAGRRAEAAQAYQRALEVLGRLLAETPQHPRWSADQAEVAQALAALQATPARRRR